MLVEGQASHCRTCALTVIVTRLRTTSGGHGDVNKKKKRQCNWWSAACGGQYDWRNPNRILVIQGGTDRREAQVFRAHAAPHGACENLVNALKFLANQQQGGDGPVDSLVQGLEGRSRLKMMDELRKFITMDGQEAVKSGDLEKIQESLPVVKPHFTTDYPEAMVRVGAYGLTVRREEEGMLRAFIDTTNVGDGGHRSRMRTGMRFARPSTRELRGRNGKTCTASTRRCSGQS